MTKTDIHNTLHYYFALIIAFSLPFGKLTPIFIILLLANWIIEGDILHKFKTIFTNKFAITFILLYSIHIIGLLYSQNIKAGLFDIQVKLSILIFPLILSSKPFNQKQISGIILALIFGLSCTSLYLLSRAVLLYITNGENAFFYQTFAVLLHPSYLSMYLNAAIAFLLLSNVLNNIYFKKISTLTAILIITFFSFIIILLSSKSGIILLALIFIIFLFYLIIFKKKYFIGIIVTLGLAISVILIYKFAPKVVDRMNYLVTALNTENKTITNESTTIRILIWGAARQVISENFILGVGNGDAAAELKKEYKKRNITIAFENNLNAHNTFYQVFVSLGLVGFSILLINVGWPLVFAIQTNNYLYVSFLLIIMFNFCFESMLETQAGVMFYAFFNSLLCFGQPKTKSNANITL